MNEPETKPFRQPLGSDAVERGEFQHAALQFIRKISGYNAPSQANREAFDRAVRDVAAAGRRLFDRLQVRETSAEWTASAPR